MFFAVVFGYICSVVLCFAGVVKVASFIGEVRTVAPSMTFAAFIEGLAESCQWLIAALAIVLAIQIATFLESILREMRNKAEPEAEETSGTFPKPNLKTEERTNAPQGAGIQPPSRIPEAPLAPENEEGHDAFLEENPPPQNATPVFPPLPEAPHVPDLPGASSADKQPAEPAPSSPEEKERQTLRYFKM